MNPFPEPSANGAPRRVRFWLRTAGLVLGVFVTIALVTYVILDEPLPTGTPGVPTASGTPWPGG